MGKILNLASLKSKADAAGVGTTATSTTPNLCPKKSDIASYVTNGSSTVSISGTWADNLLVPEENVSVGKTIVTTYPRYRNVSVGDTTVPNGDIPASGGKRRALATVTYEWATVTVYSDNTETVGTWQSGSNIIYGGYAPADLDATDLGTTFTLRTYMGTSTPTGIVAGGARTGSTVSIYQEANCIASITPKPSEGHNYHISYSNISGSGGSSTPTSWGRATYTFTSGAEYTSGSTTPLTGVSATFLRTYNRMVTNPNNDFVYNSSGVITAEANPGSTTRTAVISATLTVSITYVYPYAGVYTPCESGYLTLNISCTQNVSTTGYSVLVRGPLGKSSPKLEFYSSNNTYLGEAHDMTSMSSTGTTVHSEWNNSGTATKVYISYNYDGVKYLKITDMTTSTVYLNKVLISNNTYFTLTTSFATSNFNANNRELIFDYSDS